MVHEKNTNTPPTCSVRQTRLKVGGEGRKRREGGEHPHGPHAATGGRRSGEQSRRPLACHGSTLYRRINWYKNTRLKSGPGGGECTLGWLITIIIGGEIELFNIILPEQKSLHKAVVVFFFYNISKVYFSIQCNFQKETISFYERVYTSMKIRTIYYHKSMEIKTHNEI